jgi:hypothetical protein
VNAPFEPAHSRFGGSVATRVIRCPASVLLIEKVPESLRKISSDAMRGTALHAVMAIALGDNPPALEDFIGQTFGDYTVTADDVKTALRQVLAYVDKLLDTPGAEYFLEHRVRFPGVVGAFGTADLIARVDNTIYVIDFKFGAGVRVTAVYADGDDDVLNAQLMFYATSARNSLRSFFVGVERINLVILQPMSIEPDAEMVSSVEVSHEELDAFVVAFRAACDEALSGEPRLARGDWCRFCAARPICPEHTAPLLDLSMFMVPAPTPVISGIPTKEMYLQLLADGLDLVDAVKDISRELHSQAKAALQSGDVVPGYTLTAGRAERHWHNETAAHAALRRLGLDYDDIVVETMRSPRQVEIRAKARGLRVPPELIGSHRSGVSLVRAENARAPVPGRDEIVRSFSRALEKALQGGGHE